MSVQQMYNRLWFPHLASQLYELYKSNVLFDTLVETSDGAETSVHGCVLAAASPILQQDLHLNEITPRRIKVNIDYANWKILLHFMYSGELKLQVNEVENVLEYARHLHMNMLVTILIDVKKEIISEFEAEHGLLRNIANKACEKQMPERTIGIATVINEKTKVLENITNFPRNYCTDGNSSADNQMNGNASVNANIESNTSRIRVEDKDPDDVSNQNTYDSDGDSVDVFYDDVCYPSKRRKLTSEGLTISEDGRPQIKTKKYEKFPPWESKNSTWIELMSQRTSMTRTQPLDQAAIQVDSNSGSEDDLQIVSVDMARPKKGIYQAKTVEGIERSLPQEKTAPMVAQFESVPAEVIQNTVLHFIEDVEKEKQVQTMKHLTLKGTDKTLWQCQTCSFKMSSNRITPHKCEKSVKQSEFVFQCKICKLLLFRVKQLKMHFRDHHPMKVNVDDSGTDSASEEICDLNVGKSSPKSERNKKPSIASSTPSRGRSNSESQNSSTWKSALEIPSTPVNEHCANDIDNDSNCAIVIIPDNQCGASTVPGGNQLASEKRNLEAYEVYETDKNSTEPKEILYANNDGVAVSASSQEASSQQAESASVSTDCSVVNEGEPKRVKERHTCKVCGEVFRQPTFLIQHAVHQHSDNLRRAMGVYSKRDTAECQECGAEVGVGRLYYEHMWVEHRIKVLADARYMMEFYECNECFTFRSCSSKRMKSHAIAHLSESGVDERLICKTCGGVFDSELELQEHERSHSVGVEASLEKKYLCGICGHTFKTKAWLTRHTCKKRGRKPKKNL